MNYQLIYNNLIERGKQRIKPEGYFENHHIIPKCMSGGDNSENLVNLTAREHFLCHWLLIRIYPTHQGIAQAFWQMCHCRYKDNKYKSSSRAYQEAKENFSKNHKEWYKNLSQEDKEKRNKKISIGKTGHIYSKEHNLKLSISQKNKPKHTIESKQKIRESRIGKKESEQARIKRTRNLFKPILQFDLNGNFIKEWPSQTEILNKLKIGIGDCLRGVGNTAGGFKWKYRDKPTPEFKPKWTLKNIK
jgi:hypothetical protein